MPEDLSESTLKENVVEPIAKTEPETDLVVWVAPARPFKRRNRQFYVTLIATASIVGLVLFFVEGWVPVVLIISLIFLFYVMSTVPPEDIEYKITNKGIKIAGRRSDWETLGRFWFSRRFDTRLLVIETYTIPGRIELVIEPYKNEEIQSAIAKFLVHEEIPPSNLDKAAVWFAKKLPQ